MKVNTSPQLKMITFVFVLINVMVSCHLANAFPTMNARPSSQNFALKQYSMLDFRSISIAHSATTPESLDIHVKSSDSRESMSKGLFTALFQRHKQRRRSHKISTAEYSYVEADINSRTTATTTAWKNIWHRAARRLKGGKNEQLEDGSRSAVSALGSRSIVSGRRFGPSSMSSTQQTNPFSQHRINKSITFNARNIIRISKVQSFASSSTALNMVLSTPESIIEQVSTQKLLDALIDESVRTSSREPIMMQFNPKRGWIWRQWRGTVFSETWKSGLLNMALATFVVFLYKLYPNLKDLLQGFSILWGQLLSVTTFTLTFFLNQSYGLWRKCYDYSRRLQGRLNDLGMSLAAHATRVTPSSPDIPSTYTPQSRQALELVSRYVRVFNLLTYASFTRSHRPILTPRGMRRLVERGILTPKEREILIDAEIPATQRHNAVLVWLIRLFVEGRQTGVFEGGYGFEEQFMEKCHVIRAQYGAIGDELQGRMPLAYAHIVQVLLDVVLWMYPFMALSTGMAWYIGVLGTLLLTMFYQGLFDLAKQFLDPYDNENYGKGDDPLVVDTLIAETNAGSVRWLNSFQQQPWNKQLLKDGEMYDSLLPLRGYSVEELMEKEVQEEVERREKERVLQEKKKREEENERERARQLLLENFEHIQNGTHSLVTRSNGTAILSSRAENIMAKRRGSDATNRTLLKVSGGQVISETSLFPSRALVNDAGGDIELDSVDSDIKEPNVEPHKVLTLDDGSIVTQHDKVVINKTKLEPFQPNIEENNFTAGVADSLDVPRAIISWDKIGDKTPNFAESIKEVEKYEALQRTSGRVTPEGVLINFNEDDDDLLSTEDLEYGDDDFDPFVIEWFEEVGPDGKELRLSQMLADEDWSYLNDDYDESQNKTMGYEEFTRKANEIIEQVEDEIAETKEILGSSPGSQAEYDAKKRLHAKSLPKQKLASEETEPLYDQTRLDPISQLWGIPPGVLRLREDDEEEQQHTINEELDFSNIYSLWGMPLTSKASTQEEDEVYSPPVDGVKQLWTDEALVDPSDLALEQDSSTKTIGSSEFAGLEWWDKVSPDGKEIRLSMMLADEEYEEERHDEEYKPMTFEQFAMETENLIQMVEEERKETEAIMNAPPNANFLEEADEVEGDTHASLQDTFDMVASSEKFEEMVMSLSQGEGIPDENANHTNYDDDDISILEMDVDDVDPDDTNSLFDNVTKQIKGERENANSAAGGNVEQ
ncbi:hypothetical protein ACHAWX_005445 [Stephanocyclus meneghinianus]